MWNADLAPQLQRRNRSSRRGGQPVHLSLHHHNYHYPGASANGQDPFLFGPVSIPSTASSSLASSQQSASVSIANPSHWWREEGPYILLGYLQFVFNSCLVIIGLYFLLSLLLALSRDITERTAEHSIELQQEIMHCSEMYIQNRCEPSTRVPAMEKMCKDWEFCMNRNPKVVGRTRVAAETVAEVVNGFTEVISWRTMVCVRSKSGVISPCRLTLHVLAAYSCSFLPSSPSRSHSRIRPSLRTAGITPPITPSISAVQVSLTYRIIRILGTISMLCQG